MKLQTPLNPDEVLDILKREIDRKPSIIRCLVTLNAHRYRGTSAVCGEVKENEFELRNRRDPYLSIRAVGQILGKKEGTEIQVEFEKPCLYEIFRIFHTDDSDVILKFLKEKLKAEKTYEAGASTGY